MMRITTRGREDICINLLNRNLFGHETWPINR